MNLESIPGIGPTLATAIRRQFPGGDDFVTAAKAGNLQALELVEGITPKRAVDLVRQLRGEAESDHLLATPASRKVYDHIMDELRRFAATQHGRNRLRLLGPLSTAEAANERMAHVMAQKARVADLDDNKLRALLRNIKPLTWPSPVCDMTQQVVVATTDDLEQLHADGVGRWALLVTQGEADPDAELTVSAYGETSPPPGDVDVSVNAGLPGIAPHAWIAWTQHNGATLRALEALASLMGQKTAAIGVLDLATSVQRIQVDAKTLRQAIVDMKAELDQELEETLESLQLTGAETMRAVSQGKLPLSLQTAVDDSRQVGRRRLQEQLGIALQPFEATFPLEIDEDEVSRFIDAQQTEARAKTFQAQQIVARKLAALHDGLAAEVGYWLEEDAELAVGAFAKAHDLQPAQFGSVLRLRDSVHLDLARNPGAQRIHYNLADAPRAILTGANSGGKSTLLEHLTQLVVMSHMGLPVVGEVVTPWFDSVHLVTARRGLDAGAFETFLRSFLPIADTQERCLVLADEVESVTELEAAGRILAFFLDRLATTDSMAVLVSHMAQPILQHVQSAVRIDGIEATGLDENHQLIVDRQPKMGHFARSTPELIVQRLAATPGPHAGLYADLLRQLQDPKNA